MGGLQSKETISVAIISHLLSLCPYHLAYQCMSGYIVFPQEIETICTYVATWMHFHLNIYF